MTAERTGSGGDPIDGDGVAAAAMTPLSGKAPADPTRRALIGVGLGGITLAAVAGSAAPARPLLDAPMMRAAVPGRQVWAHLVPHGLADYTDGVPRYGADFPLDLVRGDAHAPPRPTAGVPRALQAGLTGMQILQFDWVNSGGDGVQEWMRQADPTWSAGRAGFSIAPCWFVTRRGGAVRLAAEYLSIARRHVSAAKVGDRYLAYVYAPRRLTPRQWAAERRDLRDQGIDFFLVGDLQTDSSQHGGTLNSGLVDQWVPYFDAAWLFEDSTTKIWPALRSFLAARSVSFTGGVMPGYNRETSPDGGYVSPEGTRLFRRQWESQLATESPWINIVTWNDVVEHTNIKAGSDWNHTRQDINAFYAAKLRGAAPPASRPELYVTTPDFVRLGESVHGEALVLNGSATSVTAHAQVVDATGIALGAPATATVGAASAGDATTDVAVTQRPASGFVRVRAWTTTSGGRTVQSVLSAPVLIYDAAAQPTPMMRRHYYSIPAARAARGTVRLRLGGDPRTSSTVAHVSSSIRNPRYTDVLQNTRQAGLIFGSDQPHIQVPMPPTSIVGGQTVRSDPGGFYLARVIDEDERVAYSDPVYVP